MLLLTQRTISKAITITSTCILALSPFTNADGFEIGFTYADNNSDADSAGKFCPANTQIRATVKGINANDMEVCMSSFPNYKHAFCSGIHAQQTKSQLGTHHFVCIIGYF